MESQLARQQRTTRTLRTLLTIVVFAIIGYYVYSNKNDFEVILKISKINFVSFTIFVFLSSFFNAAQNAVLIRSMGIPFSNLESYGLSNISALANLILPQGVTVTKAVYLKHRYAVSYSKFSALFLGLLVIFLLVGALLMALTNILATVQGIEVPGILWIGSVAGAASSLLFFFDFPKRYFQKFGKLGALVESFSDGWNQIRSNKSCLVKACLWQIAIFISSGIAITLAYRSIDITINPVLGISLSVFISFSNLVAIIPGNFGIQETVYGYLTYLSGLMFVQGVVVSTLTRVVGLLITLLIAPFSWYFLFFRHGIKLQ
jgi:uncharacterized membrane protein YbhN (UPF0104 family)